jgi:acyl-CoA reductase-like NAD-dependent aldehyde dehydrogenase
VTYPLETTSLKGWFPVKKLCASLFVAGLLISGVVGCSGGPTTKSEVAPADKKKAAEKAVADAKEELKKAEEDLEKAAADKKDAAKKDVEKRKDALHKAEEALKAL